MDGWMNILEMGPGVGSDALFAQQVVTQVESSQMDAAPQSIFRHLLNQILIDHQPLYENIKQTQTGRDV